MSQHSKNEISLIPYGCLQFWDAQLKLDNLKLPKCYFREDRRQETDNPRYTHVLRCLRDDPEKGGLVDQITGEKCTEDYTVDPVKTLEHWDGQWLPVPFLRRLHQYWDDGGDRFARGPSNWARCRVHRLDDNTLALTLAFDTNVEEPPANVDGTFFALSPVDVSSHHSFSLADHVRDNSWLLAEPWMDEWLLRVYTASLPKKKSGQESEYVLQHWAKYLAWLQLVKEGFKDLVAVVINPLHERPVDVDLILDIGNSRSTAILVETRAQTVTNLNNSYLLELRDLSRPEYIYKEPFETKVEFSEANFGDPSLSRASGRTTSAFAWPSVVRVGPEASRLPTENASAQGSTGMSSPKRYLWDERPWQQTWRFNAPNDPHVTRGLFATMVNDEGTPRACFESTTVRLPKHMREQSSDPAFESRFTRSSLMMFMVGEIITQALVTINSPRVRKERDLPNVPRSLRRIIFTVPTAMPVAEQAIFKRWVNWAVRVIWDCLGWQEFYDLDASSTDYRRSPQVRCDWDEASCTQLVYLYNELNVKHHGEAHQLFAMMGKPRPAYANKPCIRMASIDIGGGTIDLSITAYELASAPTETTLIAPHMEFRDGFNLAGDEVLRSIIDKHISKLLSDAFVQAGVRAPESILSQLMGRDYVGTTMETRNLRARFVRQVAVPVALGMLDVCEKIYQRTADNNSFNIDNSKQVFALRDFFLPQGELPGHNPAGPAQNGERVEPKRSPHPQSMVVNAVERLVKTALPPDSEGEFSLMDMEVSFFPSSINDTIRAALGPNLATLCEIVHQYDCDLLLLTGRPSSWRGVVAPVLAKLPVPADRIIPMRQYHVGSWYPFADVHGRIIDPKTTVIVGAILCALAEGGLESFSVDVRAMQLSSTARYIGELTPEGKLINDKIWFEVDLDSPQEVEMEKTIKFAGPLTIGYRQLDAERWPTTRYHLLTFRDDQARERSNGRLPYDVSVVFQRQEKDEDRADDRDEGLFTIDSITDREGNSVSTRDLTAYLQTLELAEGYWLDTGIVMG